MAKVVGKKGFRSLFYANPALALLLLGVFAFILLITIVGLGNSSLPFLSIAPALTNLAALLAYVCMALLGAICLICAGMALFLVLLRAGTPARTYQRKTAATLFESKPGLVYHPSTLGQPEPFLPLEANHLSASPLNSKGLVISPGAAGLLRIWNRRNGQAFTTGQCIIPNKQPIAWSPDGKYVASLTPDRIAQVVEVATKKEFRRFEAPDQQVSALCWSPDAKLIALLNSNQTITFWNPRNGKEETVPKSHPTQITMLAWTVDGMLLASHGKHQDVHVWKVEPEERFPSAAQDTFARRASIIPIPASILE